jgi:hypothetical protein
MSHILLYLAHPYKHGMRALDHPSISDISIGVSLLFCLLPSSGKACAKPNPPKEPINNRLRFRLTWVCAPMMLSSKTWKSGRQTVISALAIPA